MGDGDEPRSSAGLAKKAPKAPGKAPGKASNDNMAPATSTTASTGTKRPSRFRKFLDIFPAKSTSAHVPGGTTAPAVQASRSNEWLSPVVQVQPYFHGMIHKDELATMLKRDGDFILRLGRSTVAKTNVTLSVQWSGKPRHFIINRRPDRRVFIEHPRPFKDEAALVEWYKTSQTPISYAGYRLLTPVTRQAWELDTKDIELRQEVGKGAFGKVFKGILTVDAKGKKVDVAIKLCEMTELSLEAQNQFMKEAEIGRRYDHPNVTRVYGVQHREQPLMIVMEWAAGGSLLSLIQKRPGPSEQELLGYTRQACSALEFLAIKRVLHRDIAARNFLLGEGNVVKIADFGLAKADCTIYKMTKRVRIAVRWMAPEVLLYGDFSLASEVWMFGVTIWEIFSHGAVPYTTVKSKDLKDRVVGEEKLRLQCDPSWRPPLIALIKECMGEKAVDRPTIHKVGEALDQMLGKTPHRVLSPQDFDRPTAVVSEYENDGDGPEEHDAPASLATRATQMPER